MADTPTLVSLLPNGPVDGDALLDIFVDWAMARGLELYPAQEEAILEVFEGKHVILNTPTGSGKSLVALAMHFYAFAKGRKSIYTSPIKALVSEKFFSLCEQFGAEHVGLLTGDASINHSASVICCTQEVLAAMALTEGDGARVHSAVIDEFHYYGDRDRGMAWQIPLLTLTKTAFMLMSATLGETAPLAKALHERTGREVALVKTTARPVPLEFSYAEESLIETVIWLAEQDRAPIYVVNFSQRDAAEVAGNLMSTNWCTKDEKKAINAELKGTRFDTPYGKVMAKFLRHGVGVHHAGLLPKYRLLVERLAQRGHLKIISGTDTLGVGINVPIRTVLFSRLSKYDGQKTRILSVRDFKQISGRAGRKGFDDKGWVVCQAPPHVVDNKKLARKANGDPKKLRKLKKKKPPEGFLNWNEETYTRLIESDSETLTSRFKTDHGMIINLLQRENPARGGGYKGLIDLIGLSHESFGKKRRLRREAAKQFKQLRAAGIIEVRRDPQGKGQVVQVAAELQRDFSMYHSLSLFLIHAIGRLPLDPPNEYALRVCGLAEAILEDPNAVLMRQRDKIRKAKIAELKADGVEFDERIEIIEQLNWPMPDAEAIFEAFDEYAKERPWVRVDALKPKSVARDMYERYASFNDYVQEYGLEKSEGVLLRHLNQVYKVLVQTVPEALQTDDLVELIGWLRATLQRADSSLLQAWKAMKDGVELVVEFDETDEAAEIHDVLADKKAFRALVRAEMHRLLKSLAKMDYDEAVFSVRQVDGDEWDAGRFAECMRPYFAAYDTLLCDHASRSPMLTKMDETGPRQWRVRQTVLDPDDDRFWYIEGVIDLRGIRQPEGAVVALVDIRG
jgi:superfamily II RNA helicase